MDPRDYYQGTLRRTLKKYRHIGKTIPAMGYSPKEVTSLSRVLCVLGALQFWRTLHQSALWQLVTHLHPSCGTPLT